MVASLGGDLLWRAFSVQTQYRIHPLVMWTLGVFAGNRTVGVSSCNVVNTHSWLDLDRENRLANP